MVHILPPNKGNQPQKGKEAKTAEQGVTLLEQLKSSDWTWDDLLQLLAWLISLFRDRAAVGAVKDGCDDYCECARHCLSSALDIAHHQLEILQSCSADPAKNAHK